MENKKYITTTVTDIETLENGSKIAVFDTVTLEDEIKISNHKRCVLTDPTIKVGDLIEFYLHGGVIPMCKKYEKPILHTSDFTVSKYAKEIHISFKDSPIQLSSSLNNDGNVVVSYTYESERNSMVLTKNLAKDFAEHILRIIKS